MKKWLYFIIVGGFLLLCPAQKTDVGELLPVELIRLSVNNGAVTVAADTGDFGVGSSLKAAIADLQESAPGRIYLETADYLLLTGQTQSIWNQLDGWFRPGTLVYLAEEDVNPEQAAAFLRSHSGGIPLNRMREALPSQKVVSTGGRVKLEKSS